MNDDVSLIIVDHPQEPDKFMAVILSASQMDFEHGDKLNALATATITNASDAEPWFREMLETRPWETRQ